MIVSGRMRLFTARSRSPARCTSPVTGSPDANNAAVPSARPTSPTLHPSAPTGRSRSRCASSLTSRSCPSAPIMSTPSRTACSTASWCSYIRAISVGRSPVRLPPQPPGNQQCASGGRCENTRTAGEDDRQLLPDQAGDVFDPEPRGYCTGDRTVPGIPAPALGGTCDSRAERSAHLAKDLLAQRRCERSPKRWCTPSPRAQPDSSTEPTPASAPRPGLQRRCSSNSPAGSASSSTALEQGTGRAGVQRPPTIRMTRAPPHLRSCHTAHAASAPKPRSPSHLPDSP